MDRASGKTARSCMGCIKCISLAAGFLLEVAVAEGVGRKRTRTKKLWRLCIPARSGVEAELRGLASPSGAWERVVVSRRASAFTEVERNSAGPALKLLKCLERIYRSCRGAKPCAAGVCGNFSAAVRRQKTP